MEFRIIMKTIIAGIISGFFLGVFLKAVEIKIGIKVYTLLLNVDYIPVLSTLTLPECIEFGFHLIISILLSIVIKYFLVLKQWNIKQQFRFIVIVCVIVGFLLFPTTVLSPKTPEWTNFFALFYWLLGHLLYGLLLAYLLKK